MSRRLGIVLEPSTRIMAFVTLHGKMGMHEPRPQAIKTAEAGSDGYKKGNGKGRFERKH